MVVSTMNRRERMRGEHFRVNLAEAPGWIVAVLEEAGIPMDFSVEELTEDQRTHLWLISALSGLQEKGLIEVWYQEGEGVKIRARKAENLDGVFRILGEESLHEVP
jgi:hypothetical protein